MTIATRFFHIAQLERKVVRHAYNLSIHIWDVTACDVHLYVVNLGEHDINWCGCVPSSFLTLLIVDEVVRCNLAICVE